MAMAALSSCQITTPFQQRVSTRVHRHRHSLIVRAAEPLNPDIKKDEPKASSWSVAGIALKAASALRWAARCVGLRLWWQTAL